MEEGFRGSSDPFLPDQAIRKESYSLWLFCFTAHSFLA
jgi:hypothetical protein